jgi:hypothetical protein
MVSVGLSVFGRPLVGSWPCPRLRRLLVLGLLRESLDDGSRFCRHSWQRVTTLNAIIRVYTGVTAKTARKGKQTYGWQHASTQVIYFLSTLDLVKVAFPRMNGLHILSDESRSSPAGIYTGPYDLPLDIHTHRSKCLN